MTTPESTQRWLEQSRDAWDARAEMFDQLSAANAATDDRKTELALIFDALGIEDGDRVLDAGCGTAHFAIAFARQGCVVDAIDIAPDMIERARRNAAAAGVEITFSVGDLAPLNAQDGAYATIISRMVLQFSPHLDAVLREFRRVTAPDGRLWLAVPGALSPIYRHSWKRFLTEEPEPMNYVTPWELHHLLEAQGWTVTRQWGSFDAIGGAPESGNVAAALDVSLLPLPLQQAAATVWNLIAEKTI